MAFLGPTYYGSSLANTGSGMPTTRARRSAAMTGECTGVETKPRTDPAADGIDDSDAGNAVADDAAADDVAAAAAAAALGNDQAQDAVRNAANGGSEGEGEGVSDDGGSFNSFQTGDDEAVSDVAEFGEAEARTRLAFAIGPEAMRADSEEVANRSMAAINLNSFLMGSAGPSVGDLDASGASLALDGDEGPRVVGGKFLSWKRSSALGAGGEADDMVGVMPAMAGLSKQTRVQLSQSRTWPVAYRKHSREEQIVMGFVDNFDRQFAQLYPLRPRLLLTPPNECEVEKFVCSTLRPSQTPYDELYSLEGVASFVADHFIYEPLAEPTKLPQHLPSPATVLEWQVGDSFDLAMVLTSLLLGVGYDAYVVYGTAAYSITVNDTFSATWPGLGPKPPPPPAAAPPTTPKFVVQTRPRLVSKFEERMAAKRAAAAAAEVAPPTVGMAASDAESSAGGESETRNGLTFEVGYAQPLRLTASDKSDALRGKRVHAWVLVKAGARGVAQDVFIEPSRGLLLPLSTRLYHSIEAVFNDTNFYVNVQPVPPLHKGLPSIRGLCFALDSMAAWEPVFVSDGHETGFGPGRSGMGGASGAALATQATTAKSELKRRVAQAAQDHVLAKAAGIDAFGPSAPSLDDVHIEVSDDLAPDGTPLRALTAPPTWVLPLAPERKRFEERYPGGYKVALYSRLRVEQYGPFLRSDGMVERLTHFADRDCEIVFRMMAREMHVHVPASEHVTAASLDSAESFVEHFAPGREHGLRTLTVSGEPGVCSIARTTERKARRMRIKVARYKMEFYAEGRDSHDDLVTREVAVGSAMTERFAAVSSSAVLGGEHVLRREAKFASNRVELLATRPLEVLPSDEALLGVEETLSRRAEIVDADDDVARRTFAVVAGEMTEVFHLISGHIYPSRIAYRKHKFADSLPLDKDELPPKPADGYCEPEQTSARQAAAGLGSHELYIRYVAMLRAEQAAIKAVLGAAVETKAILAAREKERERTLLMISVYDTLRRRRVNRGADSLAAAAALRASDVPPELADDPFSVFFHGKLPTSAAEAHAVKNEALEFHRDRIISQVLIIESKMARIRQFLKEKEATIIRNQDHTTPEQVAAFADEKVRLQFRLRVLKMRKDGILKTYRRKFKVVARQLWEHPLLAPWLKRKDDSDAPDGGEDAPSESGASGTGGSGNAEAEPGAGIANSGV
ncbi:coiled-coil domain-containing protein 135 [Thecamonas trahens ATCC 50062]|uniref:Coiled-coil domain-containing protein 135 n=1 Tax=Thecamonas trahens ATCC 50062 TaxID=461836 RepID=A0A0L0DDR3_THETB|nr:coiled-coil domain-containing protein 135 [Thecamonas trahens ATCC 50062]KNC50271.1 coiled-coil domain-containing protein 135 [Thecamonas trahens ATCC 50062]|eukprot:XP_013757098.1 coiled-coil domain-containing protein 135 [Thecamonas trahens ATCC 50062]